MYSFKRGLSYRWVVVLVVLATIGGALFPCGCWAQPSYNGIEHGNGHPPDHANNHRDGKWNNDPDDDGRGPDRGDGSVDDYDWNNGCGNDPDRTDDNEGLCGGPRINPPVIITPRINPINRCKIVLIGSVPELFPTRVDVHNPANEIYLIAESREYLEYTVERGFTGTVLWWTEASGHGGIAQRIECNAEIVVIFEPFSLGDGME